MSNNVVGSVYETIIQEVINSVRVDFEENGVDDGVLEDLKKVRILTRSNFFPSSSASRSVRAAPLHRESFLQAIPRGRNQINDDLQQEHRLMRWCRDDSDKVVELFWFAGVALLLTAWLCGRERGGEAASEWATRCFWGLFLSARPRW